MFQHAATCGELCELAVRGLRAITGYDRVMAYRFHDDGHGEVIAEARAGWLEPFLGLHYPAADIPAQVRRLYVRQRVGSIADANYLPVPLLVDPALADGPPLDLTHSALRSASPIHREYMRNMKTAASLAVGLVLARTPDGTRSLAGSLNAPMISGGPGEGARSTAPDPNGPDGNGPHLWGMLVCHHATPFVAEPELRAVAGMIGQVVSLLLASLSEAEVYAERLARDATLRRLVERLADTAPLPDVLTAARPELLALVDAAGALIRLNGTVFCLGEAPSQAVADRILAVLWPAAGGEVLAVDNVAGFHSDLGRSGDTCAGALLLPLASDTDDAILWFRPELARTVMWAGDPAGHTAQDARAGRLSPRSSFAAWSDTVRGRSAPWSEADLALVRQLRVAIGAAVAQRNKAALAQLRYYDLLTGLPNRSLLRERLREIENGVSGHAVTDPSETADRPADSKPAGMTGRHDDRAVVPRSRSVQGGERHHGARGRGRRVLVEVARRLLVEAGSDNMAACLGGDDSSCCCLRPDPGGGRRVGRTHSAGDRDAVEITGRACHISVSIGIAVAEQSGGLDLIRAADMAMYAAKEGGGNRGVVFEASLFDRATQQFELDLDMREALVPTTSLLYQPLFGIAGERNPARVRSRDQVASPAPRMAVARPVHSVGGKRRAHSADGRMGAGNGLATGPRAVAHYGRSARRGSRLTFRHCNWPGRTFARPRRACWRLRGSHRRRCTWR